MFNQGALLFLLFCACSVAVFAQTGVPNVAPMTSWGMEISPDNVHAEYPRPTLVRPDWLNLNGYWDWKDSDDRQDNFSRRILVPFPIESTLSRVAQHHERCVYRRTFEIPGDWDEHSRILLHFGAVDWEATVFVNGNQIGTHRGGFAPFSFDITALICYDEPNELVVHVFDPTQNGQQPVGKQSTSPAGIWYTASTGIWQTVWLEPVPQHYIESLEIHADLDTGKVLILPTFNAFDEYHDETDQYYTVIAEAFDGAESVTKAYGGRDGPLLMRFDQAGVKAWSPATPQLYQVRVQLLHNGTPVDTVKSYFAFRKIEIRREAGKQPAIYLNDKRLFVMGVIDQGYWPDGIYTAPSDNARIMDIRVAKSLGFNAIRKHQKIEPERWYFWCDQWGMLVWQDMPSGENRSQSAQSQFQSELQRMILSRKMHPSIIAWTIFNEGAGQHQVADYVELIRSLDPVRLINATSGWTDTGLGDFSVSHKFPGPEQGADDTNRAAIIGAFGGVKLTEPSEHFWTWGHRDVSDSDSLVYLYDQMHQELRNLIQTRGLAGAFFHQLTDIESECNGLIFYDRRSLKVPAETIEQINQETIKLGSH